MSKKLSPEKEKERLAKMEEKVVAATAKFELLKKRVATNERKRDTRRKILSGALTLNAINNEKTPPETRSFLLKMHDEGLTAPRDRELFDFLSDKPPQIREEEEENE